jgi:hypothetical protein
MSRISKEISELSRQQPLLLAITFAALLFGVYARFKGLGAWPLTPDEYYLARSVQNVLRAGIPVYDCGGYYPRGLLMQYVTAALQLGGLSPELAPRLIAALCSLAALPAVYLLGKRAHSSAIGLLAVIVLALSVWEVEIARFARMYAPFQALFAWYLVYFLKYTIDRDHRALWPMLALSIVGPLIWEGAALLALVNLLPPLINHSSGRLTQSDASFLAGMALLFLLIVWFVTLDVRIGGSEPPYPADYAASLNKRTLAELEPSVAPWTTIASHPIWTAMALVPLGLALLAVRWIWSFRARWLACAGLMAALVAAILHQFAAVAAVILMLLMLNLVRWRELLTRRALPFHVAVVACVAFWTAFGFLTDEWRVNPGTHWLGSSKAVAVAYEFARFPDFLQQIVLPWGRAVPILGLTLLGLISAGIIWSIARDAERPSVERAMQLVLVCMLLAASASDPPRHETRYLFFIYPLAVIVALAAIAHLVEAVVNRNSLATTFTAVAALAAFALTEDFSLRHLLNIDSPEVNFRVDAGDKEAHLQARSDPRGAARWLTEHTRGQDLAINGVPTVDFYYSGFDYTYIDWHHRRFPAYACRRGTVERWGNLPLLYSVEAMQSEIERANRAFLVIDGKRLEGFLERLARWQPHVAWSALDQRIHVIELRGGHAS